MSTTLTLHINPIFVKDRGQEVDSGTFNVQLLDVNRVPILAGIVKRADVPQLVASAIAADLALNPVSW